MPKTLGIWEWRCPKRGDAQNAVTADCPQGFSLKKGGAGKGHFFTEKPWGRIKKENIHWIKSRNWEMKEDNICQKSRQDLGPLCDFSFSCLIQISRALL